jgi:predicted site-specific integrase-resolvase
MNQEEQYLSIGKVAKILGVAVVTLRRWEKLGKLNAKFRTFGNHRRYFKSDIAKLLKIDDKKVICYSRVSSHDQKKDLIRQDEKLRHYCKENKINNVESILDLGNGLNFNSKCRKLSRGLFKDKVLNVIINSDLNGAANHIRLAFGKVRITQLKNYLWKLQQPKKIKSAFEFNYFLNN